MDTRGWGTDHQPLLLTAHAALEVHTREQLPYDWRGTKKNLGIDLRSLAEHSPPEEAAKLRAEAEAIEKELAAQ